MTGLQWVTRLLWVTVASAAMALGLSAPAAAKPMGPCAEITYVGVCVPISERATTPPRQSRPDVPVLPQGSGGPLG